MIYLTSPILDALQALNISPAGDSHTRYTKEEQRKVFEYLVNRYDPELAVKHYGDFVDFLRKTAKADEESILSVQQVKHPAARLVVSDIASLKAVAELDKFFASSIGVADHDPLHVGRLAYAAARWGGVSTAKELNDFIKAVQNNQIVQVGSRFIIKLPNPAAAVGEDALLIPPQVLLPVLHLQRELERLAMLKNELLDEEFWQSNTMKQGSLGALKLFVDASGVTDIKATELLITIGKARDLSLSPIVGSCSRLGSVALAKSALVRLISGKSIVATLPTRRTSTKVDRNVGYTPAVVVSIEGYQDDAVLTDVKRQLLAKNTEFKSTIKHNIEQLLSNSRVLPVTKLIIQFIAHSLTNKNRWNTKPSPSVLAKYLQALRDYLLPSVGSHELSMFSSSDFDDLYQDILMAVSGRELRQQRLKLARALRELHYYLVDHHGFEPSEAFSGLISADAQDITINANVLWPNEYRAIHHYLKAKYDQTTKGQRPYWFRIKVALILAWRCGLRRQEIIGLKRSDFQLSKAGNQLWLQIQENEVRSLKSLNGRRQLPLHILLPVNELETIKLLLDRVPHEYVFSSGSLPVATKLVFDPLTELMQQATNDSSMRIHHCRHSFASILSVALISPNVLENYAAFDEDDIGHYNSLRTNLLELVDAHQPSRKAMYVLSELIGHAGSETTLLHYCHLTQLLNYHYWCEQTVSKEYAARRIAFAAGLQDRAVQKALSCSNSWQVILDQIVRYHNKHTTEIVQVEAKEAPEQRLNKFAGFGKTEFEREVERYWHALLLVKRRGIGSVFAVANSFDLEIAELQRMAKNAERVSSITYTPSGQRHRHRARRYFGGEQFSLSVPEFPHSNQSKTALLNALSKLYQSYREVTDARVSKKSVDKLAAARLKSIGVLVDHYIQYSAASKYGISIPKPSQLKAIYPSLQEILNLLNISASAKLELCLDYAAGSRRYSANGHEDEAQVRLEKFLDRAGVASVALGRVKGRKGRENVSVAQDEFLLLIRNVNQHGAVARNSAYEVRVLIYCLGSILGRSRA